MHIIKILNVTPTDHLATGSKFLDVEIQVSEGKKKLHTRHVGFPEGTTDKEITARLKEMRDEYDNQAEGSAREEKKEAAKSKLIGKEI